MAFDAERHAILDIAEKGGGVFVGRCASSILADHKDMLSVFIYANEDSKIKRVMARNQTDEITAKKRIQKVDRMRKRYFDFYADTHWGESESYDMMLSNSYEITLLFIAFAFGCNIGCSVIVSQLFGAKQYSEMKTAVYTTLIAGAGLMRNFMISTFTDLVLRVALAIGLARVFGSIGIWCAWPIGWSVAMCMSVFFCMYSILSYTSSASASFPSRLSMVFFTARKIFSYPVHRHR